MSETERLFQIAKRYACKDDYVMALALHRLTGLPYGIWSGVINRDGEDEWENCQRVVIVDRDQEAYLDAFGFQPAMQDNLEFTPQVYRIDLREVDEDEMMRGIAEPEISEEMIEQAIEFVMACEPLKSSIEPYLLRPGMRP